jgi:hypothetical protein
MKKILLIILAVSSFDACKKSKIAPRVLSNGGLIGKWELHERFGGNIYPSDTTYAPGNGNIFQFNADSTYKSYVNGTLSRSGIFHTRIHFSDEMTAIRYDELYFDNDTSFSSLINLRENAFTLRPVMPDIAMTDYSKIAN